jgi:hypothetical protein
VSRRAPSLPSRPRPPTASRSTASQPRRRPNGKPKRWHLAFDSLEEIEEKLEHFRNPRSMPMAGCQVTTIIVAPEAVQDEPPPEPDPEPEQDKPADPWAAY